MEADKDDLFAGFLVEQGERRGYIAFGAGKQIVVPGVSYEKAGIGEVLGCEWADDRQLQVVEAGAGFRGYRENLRFEM